MAIHCCNGCVPPKRTDTCHSTCPDYIIEKAFHEVERLDALKKTEVNRRIFDQRDSLVSRRVKHHGQKFKERNRFKYW